MKKETRGPLEEIPFLSWISFPFWHATGKKFLSALRRARIQASKAGFLMEKQRTTKDLLSSYSINSQPPMTASQPSLCHHQGARLEAKWLSWIQCPCVHRVLKTVIELNASEMGPQGSRHQGTETRSLRVAWLEPAWAFLFNSRIAELREHLLGLKNALVF